MRQLALSLELNQVAMATRRKPLHRWTREKEKQSHSMRCQGFPSSTVLTDDPRSSSQASEKVSAWRSNVGSLQSLLGVLCLPSDFECWLNFFVMFGGRRRVDVTT